MARLRMPSYRNRAILGCRRRQCLKLAPGLFSLLLMLLLASAKLLGGIASARMLLASARGLLASARMLLASARGLLASARMLLASARMLLAFARMLLAFARMLVCHMSSPFSELICEAHAVLLPIGLVSVIGVQFGSPRGIGHVRPVVLVESRRLLQQFLVDA